MFELPEIKMEKRKYMFWLARIFGKKLCKNMYSWRGAVWVTGDVSDPSEKSDRDGRGE